MIFVECGHGVLGTVTLITVGKRERQAFCSVAFIASKGSQTIKKANYFDCQVVTGTINELKRGEMQGSWAVWWLGSVLIPGGSGAHYRDDA